MPSQPVIEAPRYRTGDSVPIGGDYQHRARTRGFVVQRFWHAEKERVIRAFAMPSASDRVLDVGCGSGVVADFLASTGAHVTAVDGNPDAIAYGRRTFRRDNLEFIQALVEELAFDDASFDRIYCMELIEHIYEHQVVSLFQAFRRLLRPGGSLLLTTPNYRGFWPVLEFVLDRLRLVPALDGHQHVTRFHASRLSTLLSDAGFQPERITTFATVAPFVSVLSWRAAVSVAHIEDRLSLPFGNLLLAVARRSPGSS
jgi:2-polyprenyl-3-methyl-5-hydroxy-6-metoxy-1,4-benzoquinol methylase